MPPGTDEEEEQQHRQGRHVLEPGAERDDGERLRQAEHDAADEGAERAAEAADDGGDEAADMANGTPTLKAVYCVGVMSTPAMAPSAALSANDNASMRETGMPCSAAASRLIAQARIALPVRVFLKNRSSSQISMSDSATIQRNWKLIASAADHAAAAGR